MVSSSALSAGALLLAVLTVASALGPSLASAGGANSHSIPAWGITGGTSHSRASFGPLVNSTFNVTFTESGLPPGTMWSVTLNGSTNSSPTASIGFLEPNGTYPYLIHDLSGWHQTTLPYNGSLVVSDASVTEPALVFTQVTYAVVFPESGLPGGETFQVTLGGVPNARTTDGGLDNLSFSEPNGTYPYSITDISGWHETTFAYRGNIVVDNASVMAPTLAYTRVTYTVVFSENGLPTGLTWQVTLNGVPNSLTTDGLADHLTWTGLANGSYAYSIGNIPGWHQTTLAYSGSITVNGGTAAIDGTGVGYSTTLFYSQVSYSVTFKESTLPAGLLWKISVDGSPLSVTTNGGPEELTWSGLANGSYSYAISDIPGWHQSTLPYSGNIPVNGGSVTEVLDYSNVTYTVTFSESGLFPGLPWDVQLDGQWNNTTTGSTDHLTWKGLTNGTYTYSITGNSGWHQTTLPYSGNVTVNGKSVTELTCDYSNVTYYVTLAESGLPSGLTWQVTLNGTPNRLTTTDLPGTLTWTGLSNGSYVYNTSSTPGWHQSTLLYNGSIIVNGGTGAINGGGIGYSNTFVYIQVVYVVTFTQSGLPNGTTWYVNITHPHHPPHNSSGSPIVFYLPNGTYTYTVASADKVYAPGPGTNPFNVTGSTVNESVTFSPVQYRLTFTEKGLALGGGANWSVTLDGIFANSTSTTINFTVTNGTYTYTIGPVAGYSVTPGSGSIMVFGAPNPRSITFKSLTTPPTNQTGPAPFEATDLVGGVLVAGALGTVAVLVLRRGKKPPKGARPPSP
jgi:hypothetical protein